MIPMAREMGMGVCPWSPLGGGVLSGKYSRADLAPAPGGAFDRKAMNAATGRLSEHNLAIAEVVSVIAAEIGCTPAQAALAWTLENPAVCSPVLGVRTVAQLEDNLGALDVAFTADQLARLDAASHVPPVFPMDVLKGPAEALMFGNCVVEERGT
jgi:aryl-alcohol dehydrogenase-like predicted oxidoreductase